MTTPTLIVLESPTDIKQDFDIFAFLETVQEMTKLPTIESANSHQTNPKVNEAILIPRGGADNLVVRIEPPQLTLAELADTERTAMVVAQFYQGMSEMIK